MWVWKCRPCGCGVDESSKRVCGESGSVSDGRTPPSKRSVCRREVKALVERLDGFERVSGGDEVGTNRLFGELGEKYVAVERDHVIQ